MTTEDWGLVERDVETAAISAAVRRVTEGNGSLLAVEGPSGIGKTRLLSRVRDVAREADLRILTARGSELERDFPFGMVRQLFDRLLADIGPEEHETLWAGAAGQAAEIFEKVGSLTSEVGDFAVLHGLFWLTSNIGEKRPAVLLVDDLQWCDAPSLRYLAHLAPRLEDIGVLLVVGVRPHEGGGQEQLIRTIIDDCATAVLRPRPLSGDASAHLVDLALKGTADPAFAAACHEATRGNPLLLRELVRTVESRGITATEEAAARVVTLGSPAVARLVALRMARLPAGAAALGRAVAVLGAGAPLGIASAMTGQDSITALGGAAALERIEILRARPADTPPTLEFMHPLVREAVYRSMDVADRLTAHAAAAELLAESGADPHQVAAHLLQTLPRGNARTVTALRAAAAEAVHRGSPDIAHTYLRRALDEPPPDDQRLACLMEAAHAAGMVDLPAAARHLEEALGIETDPGRRAETAYRLGRFQLLQGRFDEALRTWTATLEQLPPDDTDVRRRLQAGVLNTQFGFIAPRPDFAAYIDGLRALKPCDSVGGRMLDCFVAAYDSLSGDPAAVPRAVRGTSDGQLVRRADGDSALNSAWMLLIAADHEGVMDSLEAAVTAAHRGGSVQAVRAAFTYRGRAWHARGSLREAEADLRRAVRAADEAGIRAARLFTGPYLATVLIERGRIDDAADTLAWVDAPDPLPPHGVWFFFLEARARLLRARNRPDEALAAALDAGRRFAAVGGRNPAYVAWRSEAALALHTLDRTEEALRLAAEEVELARHWGAPSALGRALHVHGLLTGGEAGLRLLEEAVAVLAPSPARLEHAHALAALGSAMRRAGRRVAAREPLGEALETATACGATPLCDHVRAELLAAGSRARAVARTGPGALTPSEHRVADLAADGATNRQIAQALFITAKTVEVHLSSVYRKLEVAGRADVAAALRGRSAESTD